jgi:hypothetical protein
MKKGADFQNASTEPLTLGEKMVVSRAFILISETREMKFSVVCLTLTEMIKD